MMKYFGGMGSAYKKWLDFGGNLILEARNTQ